MKKYDEYFENERMLYVVAIVKGDKVEAALHLGRMHGYTSALVRTDIDFEKINDLHERIMTAIDFAYRMERRYRKGQN